MLGTIKMLTSGRNSAGEKISFFQLLLWSCYFYFWSTVSWKKTNNIQYFGKINNSHLKMSDYLEEYLLMLLNDFYGLNFPACAPRHEIQQDNFFIGTSSGTYYLFNERP